VRPLRISGVSTDAPADHPVLAQLRRDDVPVIDAG
jgi:hypothetical protein